jgi:hypothetical protein
MSPLPSKTAARQAAPAGISLAPSTFLAGGGLIDDVDVEVVDAQFVLFDYNGKVATPVPALGLSLKELGDEGKTHDQYFSAGDAQYFAPSDDGTSLIPTGDKTSISSSSKCGLFLTSLVNAGVPESFLASGNIKDLVGMQFHVVQQAAPKRTGGKFQGQQKENATDLVVSKLIAMPGEGAAATTKKPAGKAAPAKTNGAAAAPVDEALASATEEAIINVLAQQGGTVLKKDISGLVFKSVDSKNPLRAQMMKLAFDDNFLGGLTGITFDGNAISLA